MPCTDRNFAMTDPIPSAQTFPDQAPQRVRNLIIAGVAIVLSVILALGVRSQSQGASLVAMARESVPLEVALSNGNPTLMEFYADWCSSCQAMAGDLQALKTQYGEQINFVMLNVDNSKWLPEILSYRVDGIPHFVYLSSQGQPLAEAIGEQPRTILEQNLLALAEGKALPPMANRQGQTSTYTAPRATTSTPSDPRSHGAQVKSPT
jgi:thiol-disulfide isomerase/thioredoxin